MERGEFRRDDVHTRPDSELPSMVPGRQSELHIDLLRVGFILCVLAAHVRTYMGFDPFPTGGASFMGRLGVVGFVVLSGYSLGLAYRQRSPRWRPFLVRRLTKLWPLYALVVVLHLFPVMRISLGNAISHLLLVNVFFPEYSRSPGSIWFVAMIFQAYLLFPFIHGLCNAGRGSECLLLAILIYLLSVYFVYSEGLYLLDTVLNYIPDFCLGFACVLFGYLDRYRSFLFALSALFAVVAVGCFCSPGFFCEVRTKLLCLLLVFVFMFVARWFFVGYSGRVVSGVAGSTMCVFLFHRLVWEVMRDLYKVVGAVDPFVFFVVVGVPLIFAFSFSLQLLYSNLLRNLSAYKSAVVD